MSIRSSEIEKQSNELTLEQQSEDQFSSQPSIISSEEVDAQLKIERKLLWKIDLRLLPFLSLCYLIAFLDRSSISNAVLYGLLEDIGINDTQYLICLSVFFIPYSFFEIPFNILMKKLKPSIALPSIVTAFSIIFLCTAFVKSYGGLLALRLLLGVSEAGLFPGVNYLLSCWYKRAEFGLRAAIFFSSATLAGAFGGLLAAAIGGSAAFTNLANLPSWSWIFIVEGIIGTMIGIIAFWIIPDFPADATFITEKERTIVLNRLNSDGFPSDSAHEVFSYSQILRVFRDPKVILGIFMYAGVNSVLYGFSLFIPTIIRSIGSYSATQANLLTVPVYAFGCILCLAVGYLADRYQNRIIWHFVLISIGIVGYIILIASTNSSLSYFALYLSSAGIFPIVPSTIALLNYNFYGATTGISIACFISFGNLSSVLTSNIYRAETAPRYFLGHGVVIGCLSTALISNIIYFIYIKRENAAKDSGERDEVIGVEGITPGQIVNGREHYETLEQCQAMKGDRWSGFKYLL